MTQLHFTEFLHLFDKKHCILEFVWGSTLDEVILRENNLSRRLCLAEVGSECSFVAQLAQNDSSCHPTIGIVRHLEAGLGCQ